MTSAIRAQRENEDGFTLIELLVVVIIIGILAAIAIPAFLNQRENAYRSAAESDARNAALAMESYFTTNDAYPAVAVAGTFEAFPAAVPTEVSSNVTLFWTHLDATGQTYAIQADHALLDTDGDGTADEAGAEADGLYCSDSGGIQADPNAGCP